MLTITIKYICSLGRLLFPAKMEQKEPGLYLLMKELQNKTEYMKQQFLDISQ